MTQPIRRHELVWTERLAFWLAVALAGTAVVTGTTASAQDEGHDESLANVGAKLSNPVSDLWAINMQVGVAWSAGDLNRGSWQTGGFFQMQPALPFPLYKGERTWRLILRPTIPVALGAPVPEGLDEFDHETGLADALLPLLVAPSLDHWILGAGPGFLLPTATRDEFGRRQWGLGPALVFGYKTEQFTALVFPNYIWRIAGRDDQDETPNASFLTLQYAFTWNLPDAWQIGINNTASYDHQASAGNKWNLPIGPFVSRTMRFGRMPVKFQLSAEYSVVHEDDFGQRAQIKFAMTPVIPGLVQKPILGVR